jgi:hypothetical protein
MEGIQGVINSRSLLVAGLVAGLTVLAILSVLQSPARTGVAAGTSAPSGPVVPSGSAAPSASATPSGSAVPSGSRPASLPAAASYEDGSFGTGLTTKPTAASAQAKLWFNDGSWWATLVDPATESLHIARLDWATQQWRDTGTLVDDRLDVRADAVWDGTRLTIVTAGSRPTAGQAARLIRFHYVPATHRYVVDPDFPITLVPTGVEAPTIARDSKGVLWLSYLAGGALVVRHSVRDDYHWAAVTPASIPGLTGTVEQASLLGFGGRVALAWSPTDEDVLRVAMHKDGDADGAWSATSTPVTGLRFRTDGLGLRAYQAEAGWRLFIAMTTGQDPTANSNPLAPAVVLSILEPTGSWTNAQVARVKDNLIHPVVVLDPHDGVAYVVAATSSTGQIVYKRSPLDKVAFESGAGDVLIASPVDATIANPTTTKQDVDGESGLVVLAADDTTGRSLHGAVAIGGLALAPGRPGDAVAGIPPPVTSPPVVNILAHDTFNPWAPGTPNPDGWLAESQGGGKGNLVVVAVPSATDHALRLFSTSATGSLRACLSTPEAVSGVVTVSELVRLNRIGGSDTIIGSVRGAGGEAASVRVTRDGLLAYFNGAAKVGTAVRFRTATWYRSTIVIHLPTKTFDWALTTAGGRGVLRVRGIHWRSPALNAVDAVCAQTSTKRPGQAIFLNDVLVTH